MHTERLVYSSRRYDHVTPLLRELHWLRMSQRIDYKLAVLVPLPQRVLAPSYLTNDLQCVADLDARMCLCFGIRDYYIDGLYNLGINEHTRSCL